MKIVIISNLYKPYVRGGAEMLVGRLAESLRDNLHHVTVISTQPYDGWKSLRARSASINDVPVYRFFPLNVFYYMNDYRHSAFMRLVWHIIDIFNIHSYVQVKRVLKQEKPDVVITHNLMGIGFLIPGLIKRLNLPHIHTLHDVQLYAPSGIIIKGKENSWSQRIANLLGYPKLMKKLFGSPRAIISPSHFLLSFYKDKGYFPQSHKVVLRNPIELEQSITHTAARELRLVYLGQVSKAKGVLKLIDVVKNLDDDNVYLKVIGLGPDLRQALDMAQGESRIQFYGWRSGNDIIDLLGQSDILIMPSICYENSPTVIFEALSLGLPVVSSNIGGAPELIAEGKNGWVFEAGNWKELSNIIQSVAENKGQLQNMRQNCLDSVAAITVSNYISELLKLIEQPHQQR